MRPMYEKLLEKKNVVGVGAGYKVKNGVSTDQLAVVVLVETKVNVESLLPEDLVPKTIGGLPTDVIEVGKIVALSTTDKHRPAPGGVSIGHFEITAGTFGATVRDRLTKERYILSNNHVLANMNDCEIGDPILQPGPYDGGTVAKDTIAELLDFVPIDFETSSCPIAKTAVLMGNAFARLLGSSKRLKVVGQKLTPHTYNVVDCAIAKPMNEADILDTIMEIGTVNGVKEATLGLPLRKFGRTTEYTEDKVLIVGTTLDVSYGEAGIARFEEQIVAGPMSAGGDSGSLVLNGNDAVGLLFAGSDTHTILNPIGYVLSELDVEF